MTEEDFEGGKWKSRIQHDDDNRGKCHAHQAVATVPLDVVALVAGLQLQAVWSGFRDLAGCVRLQAAPGPKVWGKLRRRCCGKAR